MEIKGVGMGRGFGFGLRALGRASFGPRRALRRELVTDRKARRFSVYGGSQITVQIKEAHKEHVSPQFLLQASSAQALPFKV